MNVIPQLKFVAPPYDGRWVQTLSSIQHQYWILSGITLLAALLRIYRLGDWSFWGDELFTVSHYKDGFNDSWWRESLAGTLVQATIGLLGTNEWSARLAPAGIGILSIPLLYLPLRRVVGGSTALLVVLLLALSPWHLYWSQNARFYTSLLLFYNLALLTAYIGFEEDRPWFLVASMLLLALAARERLLALFYVPVMFSYLVAVYCRPFVRPLGWNSRNLILFTAPGLILAILFAGPYIQDLAGWMRGFGHSNNGAGWLAGSVLYYVGLPLCCLAIAGAFFLLRQGNRLALLLCFGAIIPLMTLMVIAPFHYTANRYAFITLLSWLTLAALAIKALYDAVEPSIRLLVAGVVLVLVVSASSEVAFYFRHQNGNRENGRAAYAFIEQHRSPDDLIIASNRAIGEYYLQGPIMNLSNFVPGERPSLEHKMWFVIDMTAKELFPAQVAWIEQNACAVANFDVHFAARVFTMRVYHFHASGDHLVHQQAAADSRTKYSYATEGSLGPKHNNKQEHLHTPFRLRYCGAWILLPLVVSGGTSLFSLADTRFGGRTTLLHCSVVL